MSNKINHQIKARQVRCFDSEGKEVGIMNTSDALRRTADMNVDLIEIQPNANPPVCKMMQIGKYLYTQKKMEKENKQAVKKLKEVCFHVGIDENDEKRKVNDVSQFLVDGHPVKVDVKMMGRDQGHAEFGWKIINEIMAACRDSCVQAKNPGIIPCKGGVMISMSLNPKKSTPSASLLVPA